jgi:hypothetical protein
MDWEEREFPERRTERYEFVSNGREVKRRGHELARSGNSPAVA